MDGPSTRTIWKKNCLITNAIINPIRMGIIQLIASRNAFIIIPQFLYLTVINHTTSNKT
ncbi:hypothetical protein LRLP16767_LR3C6_01624 [Limosilactobacillus reuteri subsp. porcinus]|uniref:Uncharacterized protein n=1 Tax=Limosilactobacillus reuteri TaxID=1598 RepID=A0A0U5F593_LIMRT|nr:hypothetical protein LRLP16767_LR3C6_01624 [Limosilactobacillus reuteri subsp. porcinus]